MKTTYSLLLFSALMFTMAVWHVQVANELYMEIEKRDSVNAANIAVIDSIKKNYSPIVVGKCQHK